MQRAMSEHRNVPFLRCMKRVYPIHHSPALPVNSKHSVPMTYRKAHAIKTHD